MANGAHCVGVDAATTSDIDAVRHHLRVVLRDVNDLVSVIESAGLPEGTHALTSALRQRLDDLVDAIDRQLTPVGLVPARRAMPTAERGSMVVDESVLDTLVDDLGGPARVGNLVQLFLTELHGRRLALGAAVDDDDLAAAKAVAHTLKSSALLLGANDLGRACEVLLTADDGAAIRPMVDEVLTQATAAARWFQIWLAAKPVTPA